MYIQTTCPCIFEPAAFCVLPSHTGIAPLSIPLALITPSIPMKLEVHVPHGLP